VATNLETPRKGLIYFALTLCVLGLASRRYLVFPSSLNAYVGDALWAVVVFLGV